jgi:hypothetical protein
MRSLTKIFILIIILFTFIFNQIIIAQEENEKKGKIKEFEKELEKTKDDTSKDGAASHDNSDEEEPSFWGWLIGEFVVKPALFYTFIGSSGDDDSPYSVNLWNSYFTDYPYQASNAGLYASPDQTNKRFSMKLFGNYFYNSADLQGFDFRTRICPLPFLGAALDFTDLTEELGSEQDHIQIYNIFLNYYRGRSEHLALWWGLGVKGMEGDKTRFGPAFNFGTEIYPIKPISFHFNYNIGFLNDKGVGELLLHLNYHVQRSIVFIGYHRYSVGSAILDGAIAGIGVYL